MSWFTKDEKDKDQDLPQPQLIDKTISTVVWMDKKVTLHTRVGFYFFFVEAAFFMKDFG